MNWDHLRSFNQSCPLSHPHISLLSSENFEDFLTHDVPHKSFLILQITQEMGSGVFSDYSNIQFVNISGIINSLDPSAGTITYRKEMMYLFSCRYPLQYLVNNTEMSVWV